GTAPTVRVPRDDRVVVMEVLVDDSPGNTSQTLGVVALEAGHDLGDGVGPIVDRQPRERGPDLTGAALREPRVLGKIRGRRERGERAGEPRGDPAELLVDAPRHDGAGRQQVTVDP